MCSLGKTRRENYLGSLHRACRIHYGIDAPHIYIPSRTREEGFRNSFCEAGGGPPRNNRRRETQKSLRGATRVH
jgi:hypothetical protein